MRAIFSVFTLLSLFFISCSQDTMITPPVDSSSSGNLNFTLDKTTMPSNVAVVKVILSRDSLEDISGIMDITSSTTAQLQFKDIKPGLWHIKVDAYNSSEVIIYSGETEVNVIEDKITDIHLTLAPVTNGLGTINLTVNWGVVPNQIQWEDKYGPVLSGGLYFQRNGVYQPDVHYEDGVYKMWYAGINNSNKCYIFYALSRDGINWIKDTIPCLSPSYSWDSYSVGHPKVIKVNNIYYMYYRGEADTYGNWNIGVATSTDGVNWTRFSTPILNATNINEHQIVPNSILYHENKFYLYYTASNDFRASSEGKVYLATSLDGKNFIQNGTPILTATLPWEGTALYQATIIKDDSKFKMYYNEFNYVNTIGYAESIDGIKWDKKTEPVFNSSFLKDGWARNIVNMCFVKINDEYRMYIAGQFPDSHNWRIGLLTVKN